MNKVYNFFMKYGSLLALVVSVVILVVYFFSITGGFSSTEGIDSGTDLAKYIHQKDAQPIDFFNFGLKAAIVMTFIAAFAWVLFGLFGLVLNPKGSLKFLLSLAVVVVLFLVFKGSSPNETTGRLGELLVDPEYHVGDWGPTISAGLKTMLSLFGLSIVTLIVSELISMFK